MPKQVATFTGWSRSPSVGVSNERTAGPITRVEVYADAAITWRGTEYTLPIRADMSWASSGWTNWRVVVSYKPYDVNLSDTAIRAVYAVIEAPMLAWISSAEYRTSYRRAVASLIARTLRDERYSVDRLREMIVREAANLTGEDAERLNAAVSHLAAFLELLDHPDNR